jgi:hypothetical protein
MERERAVGFEACDGCNVIIEAWHLENETVGLYCQDSLLQRYNIRAPIFKTGHPVQTVQLLARIPIGGWIDDHGSRYEKGCTGVLQLSKLNPAPAAAQAVRRTENCSRFDIRKRMLFLQQERLPVIHDILEFRRNAVQYQAIDVVAVLEGSDAREALLVPSQDFTTRCVWLGDGWAAAAAEGD